jgi:hypothetical protein
MPDELTTLPNVGPAIARKLRRLGYERPADLRGADPEVMVARLELLEGRHVDPCVLDTFHAVVDHVGGAPARPWWAYSRARLARAALARE